MAQEIRGHIPISTIAIAILATIVIIALAFVYYFFATTPYPSAGILPAVQNRAHAKIETSSTEVINFMPPEILPAIINEGECKINSVAQPYRPDAWRCALQNSIYDPCFSTALSDIVYCKINPLQERNDFLIKLAEPLPAPVIPKNIKENWAWFLELEDGTYCSPYTGTRPIISGQAAFYGCRLDMNNELTVLLGDIKKEATWTATKAILVKIGGSWAIKSSAEANIKKIWR